MKKVLIAAFMLVGVSMFAASYQSQIMLNGVPDVIKMEKGTCGVGGSVNYASWLKEHNDEIIIGSFSADKEWKKGEFSFTPKKDGRVFLQLSAWTADDKGRPTSGWILIDDITAEGATLENGNFDGEDASVWKLKVNSNSRAEIVENAGRDSSNAAKISHECTADYNKPLLVKAGQEVKIYYWYKIAP